jgi:hypothetical protein
MALLLCLELGFQVVCGRSKRKVNLCCAMPKYGYIEIARGIQAGAGDIYTR